MDGTHYKINEPKPFSSEWSSQKFGGHAGLNYKIALAVWDSKLLWVHGPTRPGVVNDMGVFRGDGLEKSLRAKIDDEGLNIGRSIRGIADEGYRGEPEYLSTQNQFDSKEIAWFKSRALARHETFNANLKTFQILDGTFRHSHNQHQAVFEAVCAVTVYKMDAGAGLLDPYP
jgi:DDE superfamily endonuclease